MVPVEILLNFGNYFRTLQLGFWKFLSGIVFLHHYVRTIGLFFSQAHSIWPKPRAFNPDQKSMGTPTFYCGYLTKLKTGCLLYRHYCWLYKKKLKILKIKGVPKILCFLHIVNYLRNTAFDFPQIFFEDQWQSYLKCIIKG